MALALALLPVSAQAAAAEPAKPADAKAAAAAPKEIVAPKSVFATDPKKGKDPFFPKSERWDPKPKVVTVATNAGPGVIVTPPVEVKKNYIQHFELKGYVGSGNNRVVTISSKLKNYIVMLGESKAAITPDGPARFKILRYTDTGVVIQVEGEKADKAELELKLPTP
ncbi:MAG: hypothetical protein K0Q55_2870 [Verrucomicrobia bacterium]|nr:hypothetical protein [Verrucomicrobiota bacterium]